MRMLGAGIDAQLRQLLAGQRAFTRHHPLDGELDGPLRETARQDLAGRRFYMFGIEIWPHEFDYVAGLLIMAGIGLFLVIYILQ